jgi:CHAD domain-containing protein
MELRPFAVAQTTRLLERLAFHVSDAAHSHAPDSVHDLRVAIRRFSQGLAVGKSCFDTRELKKIRRRLKAMMSLTGDVRDCDVAIKLVTGSKAADAGAVEAKLRSRRAAAQKSLLASLRHWASRKSV